jgi:GNAT superfamily N-acetyltransferase
MRTYSVPGSRHVGPSMRPDDLGSRLLAGGFEGGPEPGMAAELDACRRSTCPRVWRSRVSAVTASSMSTSRCSPTGSARAFPKRRGCARCTGGPRRRHVATLPRTDRWFGGRVRNDVLRERCRRLYFVCTSPDARRRGVGAAINRAALIDARDDGMRVGVLGSSPIGQRVYERIGFRTVCDSHVFEWSPARDDRDEA